MPPDMTSALPQAAWRTAVASRARCRWRPTAPSTCCSGRALIRRTSAAMLAASNQTAQARATPIAVATPAARARSRKPRPSTCPTNGVNSAHPASTASIATVRARLSALASQASATSGHAAITTGNAARMPAAYPSRDAARLATTLTSIGRATLSANSAWVASSAGSPLASSTPRTAASHQVATAPASSRPSSRPSRALIASRLPRTCPPRPAATPVNCAGAPATVPRSSGHSSAASLGEVRDNASRSTAFVAPSVASVASMTSAPGATRGSARTVPRHSSWPAGHSDGPVLRSTARPSSATRHAAERATGKLPE